MGVYLIGIGGGPDRAIPGFLDVVLIGTLDDIEAAILQHVCQSLLRDDLVETQGLVLQAAGCDIHTDTAASFYVLIWGVFYAADDWFYLQVWLTHAGFAANEEF